MYWVGIDLGTTHCVLSYVEQSPREETLKRSASSDGAIHLYTLAIPQWVGDQQCGSDQQLPSLWLLRAPQEPAFSALPLPWSESDDVLVGSWARQLAEKKPQQVISSAKSWLSQTGMDAQKKLLPLAVDDETTQCLQRTPYQVTCGLLAYLQAVWDQHFPHAPLVEQQVVVTLPASFHPAARELTAQAAQGLGITHLTLLEEPQAAAYHWLWQNPDWRQQLQAGDRLLVVDVGGGTSDFSVIDITDQQGELQLQRVAVGEHILLGGDNMDLALAYALQEQAQQQGQSLKNWQVHALIPACRSAKETLFTHTDLAQVSVVIPSRSASLFANSVSLSLTRELLNQVVLEGFFPQVSLDCVPAAQSEYALSSEGLPYAQDAAISKHLAAFLQPLLQAQAVQAQPAEFPNKILLNGGVFKASALVQRLQAILQEWHAQHQASALTKSVSANQVELLSGADYDLAVAKGAAYYAYLRSTQGLRIRSGLAHSYYLGIATAGLAIPGRKPPLQSICIAPFGMEEGSQQIISGVPLNLQVGTQVQFQFFSSRHRNEDWAGQRLDEDDTEDLQKLPALSVTLPASSTHTLGMRVSIRLMTRITEMGTLEIHAEALDGSGHWQVALDVRKFDSLDLVSKELASEEIASKDPA